MRNLFNPATTRGSLQISVVICASLGLIAALSEAIEEGKSLLTAPLCGILGGACIGVVVFAIVATASTIASKKNKKSFLNIILNRNQDEDE